MQPVSWVVFERLADAELDDPGARERMSREQRLLFAINLLRQEVQSGGFDAYFRFGHRDPVAVEAGRLLGPEWHELVTEAFDVPEERHLGEHDEHFDELDQRLYALEADHPADDVLDRFVRTHQAAFPGSGMIHP